MSTPPGRLLASGRAADVYDLGAGTVLRRYRTDRDCALEARVMVWVGEQGVPVPSIVDVEGRDIVMDLVAGPTMLDDVIARPWRIIAHARLLAHLQRRVNELVAPEWFPTAPGVPIGDRVVHVDLHPMNVLLSASGPVIIDWTNAVRGVADFDAAMTYVLMASVETNGLRESVARRVLVETFRMARGRSVIRSALPEAIAYRLADRNVTTAERRNLEALLGR
jgi:aminoglycoside phosphotransferase (APT) family kinase protein